MYRVLLMLLMLCVACKPKFNVKLDGGGDTTTYFEQKETGAKDGGVEMIQVDGKYKVWTKRIGNNPKIKVLLLHGGPCVPHDYFESFESFLPKEGVEFIYYDQLGCGNSDNPNDSAYWDLTRYVEEVETVRKALDLTPDNFFLLGHSWGGILAIEYALKYQQNLKGLIISNMMCDAVAYGKYADEVLAKQMEPSMLARIRELEAAGKTAEPEFMDLLMKHYYSAHICRIPLADWPEPVNRAFRKMNAQCYTVMQGPSEFGISGRLEKWNRAADLKNIKTRTLVIGATHDTMDPAHMKWMSEQFPNGSFLLCEGGSHMCMWDTQEIYFPGLLKFLKSE